jgi:hypothetical protein
MSVFDPECDLGNMDPPRGQLAIGCDIGPQYVGGFRIGLEGDDVCGRIGRRGKERIDPVSSADVEHELDSPGQGAEQCGTGRLIRAEPPKMVRRGSVRESNWRPRW